MPNEVIKMPDGKFSVKLETGEVFEGDPLDVTNKMAEAHVNTKRWGQGFREQYEALKTETDKNKTNGNGTPPTPPAADPNEAQLQAYLLDQTAKALGYANSDEYKRDLSKVKSVTSEVEDNLVATAFLSQCPDFPNTPEAIDALSKKIEQLGGQFRPIDMVAAHSLCVREGTYKPLTSEEINNQWANNMSAANRGTPPPPPPSGSPDTNQTPENEYNMSLDKLRQQILERNAKGERAIGGNLENV